ncbi:MAG: hypothetical protein RBT37_00370 [Dissulfurispiraceae bacterium]|jgi:hypothetical protein|nr:hypothetical protein [Dissulfurispiraceae bacterium]
MNNSKGLSTAVLIFGTALLILTQYSHAAKIFTDDDLKKFRPAKTEQPAESDPAQTKSAEPAAPDKPAEEPAKPVAQTFTFYYDGTLTGINISTIPANKKVNIDFQIRNKSLYICHRDLSLSQRGRTITLSPAPEGEDSAKFSPGAGWEGCSVIYYGVSRSAVIGPLPDWFDFKESFSFNFRGRILTIDQP